MPVFTAPDFDNHEQVVFGSDAETGLRCIVAIHNTALGPALGGCRMRDYATEEDALTDALRLSRGMTYKAAIAGIPYGGGKAVILGDPAVVKTPRLLRAFGRFIDSLGGRYITAEDVGTTVGDMDIVRQKTAYARGISDGSGNPSPATAYGVYMAIRAAVQYAMGRTDLSGIRIAVQGLGNVGYALCRFLNEEGARLFVADIRPETVNRAVDEFGAEAVPPDQILGLEVEVFSPCALGAVINDFTIGRLKAGIVAGGANNQLTEPRHGEELNRRRILYAPDYVANAGGVIDVASEGPGYSQEKVLRRVEAIGQTMKEIFIRAEAEKLPTSTVADRMAEEIIHKAGAETIAA